MRPAIMLEPGILCLLLRSRRCHALRISCGTRWVKCPRDDENGAASEPGGSCHMLHLRAAIFELLAGEVNSYRYEPFFRRHSRRLSETANEST